MTMDLYYTSKSAACSAVLITIKMLELPHNLIPLDLSKKEHRTPEFVKLNPQHTVPTLRDTDGFVIWESRAIMTYLVEKYGKKDHNLYPTDTVKRAVINQRLYFDLTLYQRFADSYYPVIYATNSIFGAPIPPHDKLMKLEEALHFLEKFLIGKKYVAGDEFTLADISLITTMTFIQSVDYDLKKFTNIGRWLSGIVDQIPDYEEIHGKTVSEFRAMYLEAAEK